MEHFGEVRQGRLANQILCSTNVQHCLATWQGQKGPSITTRTNATACNLMDGMLHLAHGQEGECRS
jgi:hypothetical protein